MWLSATNLSCTHGFSTRYGGVSTTPFNSLNLGGSEDRSENIENNRKIALGALKLSVESLCVLKQVHGVEVCNAARGSNAGDALVTNDKNLILAVSTADCYPVLFYDDDNKVIGAAHAGWRGTVNGIAANVVKAMQLLGAEPARIKVAISKQNFHVGEEVIQQFREKNFPESCWTENKVDLIKCNSHVLIQNKILERNIFALNRCSFEEDFFSYRRDKGITGRMWGLISMKTK